MFPYNWCTRQSKDLRLTSWFLLEFCYTSSNLLYLFNIKCVAIPEEKKFKEDLNLLVTPVFAQNISGVSFPFYEKELQYIGGDGFPYSIEE